MSNLLFWDTETTGLPIKALPLDHPSQPHIVSCSALQVTSDGYIRQSMSKLVASDGWPWDDSNPAFQVHRLSVETCRSGRSEKDVLTEILHLWFPDNEPATLVAHNLEFDRAIIASAIARYYPGEAALLDAWLSSPGLCTMLANKERIDARTTNGRRKNPNLKETLKFFTGEDLDRHHSANADAVAVYMIYQAMQQED